MPAIRLDESRVRDQRVFLRDGFEKRCAKAPSPGKTPESVIPT